LGTSEVWLGIEDRKQKDAEADGADVENNGQLHR